MFNEDLFNSFLETALREDLGDGDHSSLACIPPVSRGSARLLVKDNGIIAGIGIAERIFLKIDPGLQFDPLLLDGDPVKEGDIAFTITGNVLSILKSERLILNVMQRMSGIATLTNEYVKRLEGLKTRILDTRKTAPGIRILDKEAVRIGGGMNHRMGLFDMIVLKDNHIDFAGGIENAVSQTAGYLADTGKDLRIEIEARNLDDVRKILKAGRVHRIMLDNFSIAQTRGAVELIAGRFETESSGKISLENVRDYASCGVDYISAGALTHQVRSLDLSLKAIQ
jgi:nicotinate-nucleotide pyrophosphorylase (carboxylating)